MPPQIQAKGKIKAAANKTGEQLGCSVGVSYPCGAACFGVHRPCSKNLSQQAAQAAQDLMDMLTHSASKSTTSKQVRPTVSKPKTPTTTTAKPKSPAGAGASTKSPGVGGTGSGGASSTGEGKGKGFRSKTPQTPPTPDKPMATTNKPPTSPPVTTSPKKTPPATPPVTPVTPKTPPTPTSKSVNKPPRQPNELEQKWHATVFKNSPETLKKVVDTVGAPRKLKDEELPPSHKTTSHYNAVKGGMHMNPKYTPGETRADTVYRHEFGHYLDHQASLKAREKKAKELGIDLQKLTQQNIQSGNPQILQEAERLRPETGGSGYHGSAGYGFISSSKEGVTAFSKDERRLVGRKVEASKKYIASAKKAGLEAETPKEAIQKGKELIESRILKMAGDRKQKVYQLAEDYFAKNPSIHADAYKEFKKRLEKQAADTGVDVGVLLNQKKHGFPIVKLMRSAIVQDDEGLAEFADGHIESGGYRLGNDLAGSITANKVSRGHDDDYYKKGGITAKNTEAFANLVAGYGYGEESFHNKYVKHLSPNGHKFVVDSLNSLLE